MSQKTENKIWIVCLFILRLFQNIVAISIGGGLVFIDQSNSMLLAFILLLVVPVGLSSCSRRWEWSFSNPAAGTTSPPFSPSCLVHQSDSVLLVNSGAEVMHLFRVNATTLDTCESSSLIGQIIYPNSSLPLSLSNQVVYKECFRILHQFLSQLGGRSTNNQPTESRLLSKASLLIDQ